MDTRPGLTNINVLSLELKSPLVVDGETTVNDTIQAMREHKLGYALVTHEDRLIGIFTERDVLRSVIGNKQALQQAVSSYMTHAPTCAQGSDPVSYVVTHMHNGGFRQIPIVDENKNILGCLRHKDIAEYLVNHYADHILNLPPDPEQIATTQEGA